MTNADVIKLVRLGVAETVIIEKIRRSSPRFDTSAKGLKRLKKAGAGEALIAEMISIRGSGSAQGDAGRVSVGCLPVHTGVVSSGDRHEFDKLPPSRFYDLVEVGESATHRLPAPVADSARRPAQTGPMKIGVVRPLQPPLNISTHGKCFALHQGLDEIMAIVSEGARQLRVRFTSADIPRGAKLYVSSLRNRAEIYGPYEGRGPSGDGAFWSPPVDGDGVLIEYFYPHGATGHKGRRGPFEIVEVSHIY